jgi:pimeloyl-ACP methyl ester carboxylesterase
MTVAALNAQAMLAGDDFAHYAAQATAVVPQLQAYALEANARRTNRETVAILSCLLIGALRSEPTYRLPVPTLLVHGERDPIGDLATGHPGLGEARAAGRVRGDPRRRTCKQPRQPRGVHRGASRVPGPGHTAARSSSVVRRQQRPQGGSPHRT